MSIAQWRIVAYEDGWDHFQCLNCYEGWGGHSWKAAKFCPFCGVQFTGGNPNPRPRYIPPTVWKRWGEDSRDKLDEARRAIKPRELPKAYTMVIERRVALGTEEWERVDLWYHRSFTTPEGEDIDLPDELDPPLHETLAERVCRLKKTVAWLREYVSECALFCVPIEYRLVPYRMKHPLFEGVSE